MSMAKEPGLYRFYRATNMKHQILDGLSSRDRLWYRILEAANLKQAFDRVASFSGLSDF